MFIKLEVPIAGVIEKTNFCNQDLNTIFRIKFFFWKKRIYRKITKMSSDVSEKSITNREIQEKLFIFRKDYQLWNVFKKSWKTTRNHENHKGVPFRKSSKMTQKMTSWNRSPFDCRTFSFVFRAKKRLCVVKWPTKSPKMTSQNRCPFDRRTVSFVFRATKRLYVVKWPKNHPKMTSQNQCPFDRRIFSFVFRAKNDYILWNDPKIAQKWRDILRKQEITY